MERLDFLIYEKISSLINIALVKAVNPDVTLRDVTVLNKGMIKLLKYNYGIEGVILDVDETLRKEFGNIPKCNDDWIDALKGELKVTILSNGKSEPMQRYFNEKGIDYITFALKPLRRNFLKACEQMEVSPDKVMVIGNDLFSDILGGKRNKMKTALVQKVRDNHEDR
ncbi:MAG: HAD hydrolase-like protein [Clostridia bacterium]|nr:HAD hydrolase-like protein [Clostridia bacterium]